jgi:hypothetical protein
MKNLIRSLILAFVPADGEETPPEAPAETPPAVAPPVEETPPEPTVESLQAQIRDMETSRDAAIREEAERMLQTLVPEAADPNYQEPPGQYPQAVPDGEPPEELTPEERLERLEQRYDQDRQQASLDQQSRRLVQQLEHARDNGLPYMDVGEVLNVIAARPDVNVRALCEMSNGRRRDAMESYHQERLQDPEHRRELGLPEAPGGGTPAPPPQRTPPRLPGKGPTTAGGTPITTANAKQILAERMRAAGWGNG